MPRRPTSYYPDYAPLLPTSGPDWRWARALEIVSSGKNASLGRDGPDIIRAIRFIRQTREIVRARPMRRVFKQDPALALAYRLANEGGRRELELQCRLLAGQSAGVIAVEMGLTRSIVETYCLMFFDVAERLDATSYILHRVIGMPLVGPPTPEALMMACAYYHGPLMIEPWLDYLDHQCEAHNLKSTEGRMRESIELLIASHSLTFDEVTNFSLVKRLGFVAETHAKMFRRRSVDGVISGNVVVRLGEMLWRATGNEGVSKQHRPKRPVSKRSRAAKLRIA